MAHSAGIPGSPIALFGPAQFRNDSDFSDDEEYLAIVEMGTRVRPSFLPAIPGDVSEGIIWKMLMVEDDDIENYRTCTLLRCVCRGWRNFVDIQPRWYQSRLAFNLRPFMDSEDES